MIIDNLKENEKKLIEDLTSAKKDLKELEHAFNKNDVSEIEYNFYKPKDVKFIEENTEKLNDLQKTIKAYNNMKENLNKLQRLQDIKVRDKYEENEINEEIERRRKEIKDSREYLSDEMQDEIRTSILTVNNNSYNTISVNDDNHVEDLEEPEITILPEFSDDVDFLDPEPLEPLEDIVDASINKNLENPKPEEILEPISLDEKDDIKKEEINEPEEVLEPISLEEKDNVKKEDINKPEEVLKPLEKNQEPNQKHEVVERKPWQWIKKNKKKILIATGVAAIGVAVALGSTELSSLLSQAAKATSISNLANSMLNNSSMWQNSIASEQAALHSANTALAGAIKSISGTSLSYNPASGIWNVGSASLQQFAQSASNLAANEMAKVSALSHTVASLAAGGAILSSFGLLSKEKSKAYINYLKLIEEEKNNLNKDALDVMKISIDQNNELTDREKRKLINKINKEKSIINIKNKYDEKTISR